MGAGQHWGLWRRPTGGHGRWGICGGNQRIHPGRRAPAQASTAGQRPSLLLIVSNLYSKQTLSPKAEGLFQRAIFQSGVATIGSYTIRDPRPQAKVVRPGLPARPPLACPSACLLAPDRGQSDGMPAEQHGGDDPLCEGEKEGGPDPCGQTGRPARRLGSIPSLCRGFVFGWRRVLLSLRPLGCGGR